MFFFCKEGILDVGFLSLSAGFVVHAYPVPGCHGGEPCVHLYVTGRVSKVLHCTSE